MDNSRRTAYLQAMGIPVWTARASLSQPQLAREDSPAESADPARYGVRGAADSGWLWVVGQADGDLPILGKIQQAVHGSKPALVAVETGQGEPTDFSALIKDNLITHIVEFGADTAVKSNISQNLPASVQYLQSERLQAYVDNPGLKRQLWNDLKRMKGS